MPDYNYNTFLVGHRLRNDPHDPRNRNSKPSPRFTVRDKIALILFIAIFGTLLLYFLTYVIVNLFM